MDGYQNGVHNTLRIVLSASTTSLQMCIWFCKMSKYLPEFWVFVFFLFFGFFLIGILCISLGNAKIWGLSWV